MQKQENKEELKKYANVPDQELHHVQKNEQDPFDRIIFKVVLFVEVCEKRISTLIDIKLASRLHTMAKTFHQLTYVVPWLLR